MLKLSKDIYASAFLLVFSIVMYTASNSIKKLTVSRIGADFAPKLVAIAILILSIFYLINSIKQFKKTKVVSEIEDSGVKEEPQKSDNKKLSAQSVLATIGLLLLYIGLLPHIGFLITTSVYLFLQMYLLADKTERKIPLFAIISVLSSVFIYFIFKSVFYLMLPAGILG